MKKMLKIIALLLFIVFVGIQFFRPERTNPTVSQGDSLFASTKLPIDIHTILKRSCKDCHSNKTVYPWYSNIAPVSWAVVSHIRAGRKELNFSIWNTYSEIRKARKLKEICKEIEMGHMPHNQYLWIHWDAELTQDDKRRLCDWTTLGTKKLSKDK